jgi:protoporphyrinogen oxidase
MRIGIIGAGISGLSAAWWLAKRGHQVQVFERAPSAGGLISSFDFAGVWVEDFYHFLCLMDEGYFRLCGELGLQERIRFAETRTGFFFEGKEYPFTTPPDLLRFSPVSLLGRLRLGALALECRWRTDWKKLDEITARDWLIDRLGRRAYEVIWHPLLALKFGELHGEISAAWVWHRIHRVSTSKGRSGYLEGGTKLLLDTLLEALGSRGVEILTDHAVKSVEVRDGRVVGLCFENGKTHDCDVVVSTLPLPLLADLLPEEECGYAEQLRKVAYIGIVCVVFKLTRPFSGYFWYNVHDVRVPFNGLVEYTNLNPLGGDAGHVVYVPYYVSTEHAFYQADDAEILDRTWEAAKLVAPGLRDEDLLGAHVSRAPFAQAICPAHFLKSLPAQCAPVEGLHLLDSAFLYPADRNQSGLILNAIERAEDIG